MRILELVAIIGSIFISQKAQSGVNPEAVDLKKINETYASVSKISMKIEYTLYETYDAKKPIDKQKGEIRKNGALVYSKIGSVEMINTGKYDLKIDHTDKTISILKTINAGGTQKPMNMSNLVPDIDKALKVCKKVETVDKGAHASCTFTYKEEVGEYEKVVLGYNKKSYLVEKMTFYYKPTERLISDVEGKKDAPKLEVEYTDINTSAKTPESLFQLESYVKKVNGKFYPADVYKNYKLITQQ